MYAVIRRFEQMRSVEEAGRRAMAGLGPMLREAPGFRGYYVIDSGNDSGMSISLFDTREAAETAHQQALGWIRQNLADLTQGEPQVFAGEVVGSVAAGASSTSAAA
jgi:hypothetical protein